MVGATEKRKANAKSAGGRCPECPRTFGSNQALAVHRRRAHGVKGASRAGRPVPPRPLRGRVGAGASARMAAPTGLDALKSLNSDGLLAQVFPDGYIPVRHLPAVLAWVSQTNALLERLRS